MKFKIVLFVIILFSFIQVSAQIKLKVEMNGKKVKRYTVTLNSTGALDKYRRKIPKNDLVNLKDSLLNLEIIVAENHFIFNSIPLVELTSTKMLKFDLYSAILKKCNQIILADMSIGIISGRENREGCDKFNTLTILKDL